MCKLIKSILNKISKCLQWLPFTYTDLLFFPLVGPFKSHGRFNLFLVILLGIYCCVEVSCCVLSINISNQDKEGIKEHVFDNGDEYKVTSRIFSYAAHELTGLRDPILLSHPCTALTLNTKSWNLILCGLLRFELIWNMLFLSCFFLLEWECVSFFYFITVLWKRRTCVLLQAHNLREFASRWIKHWVSFECAIQWSIGFQSSQMM